MRNNILKNCNGVCCVFQISKQLTRSHIFSTKQKHLESTISLHTVTNSAWFSPSNNMKYWPAAMRLVLCFCCQDLHFSIETWNLHAVHTILFLSCFALQWASKIAKWLKWISERQQIHWNWSVWTWRHQQFLSIFRGVGVALCVPYLRPCSWLITGGSQTVYRYHS